MTRPAIPYGDSARLGLLLPSGNVIAEAELRAMLPDDIGMHVTRLPLRGSSEAELLGMIANLEPAARLLGDARVDAIGFHCTAVSTFAPHLAGEISARITAATGIPAFSTADAILAALRGLNAHRLLLVTPYIEPVHQREIGFLRANGFVVSGGGWMGIDTNAEMGRLTPAAIAEQVRAAAACVHAEACFISCTAIRSAGLVEQLEAELGIPVITSNQAMAWYAPHRIGAPAAVTGYGRLFALAPARTTKVSTV
jgi:maleate isomerase